MNRPLQYQGPRLNCHSSPQDPHSFTDTRFSADRAGFYAVPLDLTARIRRGTNNKGRYWRIPFNLTLHGYTSKTAWKNKDTHV